MKLLKRVKDVTRANVNHLIDKVENPEKMVNQYLIDAEEELGRIKSKTADAMVMEESLSKKIEELASEVKSLTCYTEKAINAGNEEDARIFIERRLAVEKEKESLELSLAAAKVNTEKMKELLSEFSKEIQTYRAKRDSYTINMAICEISNATNDYNGAKSKSLLGFKRDINKQFEKMDNMIAKSTAITRLNALSKDPLIDCKAKYDTDDVRIVIDKELQKRKAG